MGGLINPFAETANVIDQIETFKGLMLSYQSETHRPNFVALNWGTLLFKGQLTSMDVEYKLFKPDGTPIRAIVKCDFRGYIEDNLRVALENPLSPDITHERLFKANDRFPLMTDKIYENPNYYIDVAKANGLTSFRKIAAGTKLFFPPVEK
jgi:nucleoid-associated protein YgaU